MRVYEFSKQTNIPTKELIEILNNGGFNVKSHMAVLPDEAVAFLNNFLKQRLEKEKPATKEIVSEKKEIIEPHPPHIEKPKEMETLQVKEEQNIVEKEIKKPLIAITPMNVGEFAEKIEKPVNEIILVLLRWGVLATKNQLLSEDILKRLVEHFGAEAIKVPHKLKEIKKDIVVTPHVRQDQLKERLPIIVVIGHVDHGKTTLLDFIRKTRVAAKEKGGITQHLGAYEATTPHGNLVFLDTPGHEAFSKIRQRGIKVADIAILIVAADDGVMPQTIEAIKHAKSMNVPIIVAINKIDKVDSARIEIIKRELAQHDILPEEWGGNTICVPISAKLGIGVDQLLEMIVLQSQLMELRADLSGPAKGYILESKLEKGYGFVATFICQNGILKVGDYFVCGDTNGRVTSLVNSYGLKLKEASPSIPVQVAGFMALAEAGDFFEVVTKNEYLKSVAAQERKTIVQKKLHRENFLNIILKTDTNSSKEALLESIERFSKKGNKGYNILHGALGDISESDVELAFNTGSEIIGLHVKAETNAQLLAQRRGVSINLYYIIYKLLEDLEQKVAREKEIILVKTKIGEAIVRQVFDIKGIGVIAGSYVKEGRCAKEGFIIAWRGRQKLGEGKIISLQREKKAVKEVHAGFECGFLIDGMVDWQIDDRLECFIDVPKEKI